MNSLGAQKKNDPIEFADQTFGLDRPAIVLYLNEEMDYSDQISLLEAAIDSVGLDVTVHILKDDFSGRFAKKYRVKGSPTYLLFASGLEKGRLLGKASHHNLIAFIKSHLLHLTTTEEPQGYRPSQN